MVSRRFIFLRRTPVFVGLLVLAGWAAPGFVGAGPVLRIRQAALEFQAIDAGDSADATVTVVNSGDSALVVSNLRPALGAGFSVFPDSFQAPPGDSVALSVRFVPPAPGPHADALVFQGNFAGGERLLAVSGAGRGPDLRVGPRTLVFASPSIGQRDTVEARFENAGTDTVRVTRVSTGDSRFTVEAASFSIAPGAVRSFRVIYLPDGPEPRSTELQIESNDFDEPVAVLDLSALETPRQTANARLDLYRVDTQRFPAPGDTVVLELGLLPLGDSAMGVEVYVGFDAGLFRPADPARPVVRTGLTQGATFVQPDSFRVESGGQGVVSFWILTRATVTGNSTLARIPLVVQAPLVGQTRIRVLNQEPGFNSKFITPASTSFTLPAQRGLVLGNTAPEIRPLPLVKGQEDGAASIGLESLASDAESSARELDWRFEGPEEVVVSISTPDSAIGRVARFLAPGNRFGTFLFSAIVTDSAGASDSAAVVLNVAPVNDPPAPPVYLTLADSSEEVNAPAIFRWQGSDPDPDDVLRFDFFLGTAPGELALHAGGLDSTRYTILSLGAGLRYFWQVVAQDASGARTPGAIRTFLTSPDRTPPVLELEPLVQVTPFTAALTWRTNELVTSRVRYGPKEGFADSVDVQEVALENVQSFYNVSLEELQPGTEYSFQVFFVDLAGNPGQSEVLGFTTTEVPQLINPGDLDANGTLSFADFILFAQAFGSSEGETAYRVDADFDGNRAVDFSDFLQFARLYAFAAGKPAGV